jgi:hypothetical protein
MDEITTLRQLRPAAPPAELEAMGMTARERFMAGRGSRRARQRWRLPVLAGGLTAAAAVAAAAALVLTSGPGAVPGQHAAAGHTRSVVTAAWTVRENGDGTVTIYLQEYANPAGLQQTLQADGVNAIVRQIPTVLRTVGNQTVPFPTCNYNTLSDRAPQAVQAAVWAVASMGQTLPAEFIIKPDAMPAGSALFLPFLTGMPAQNGNPAGIGTLKPTVLNSDTVPACVPNHKVPPPGGAPTQQESQPS